MFLEAKNLGFQYKGGKAILQDLSFGVEEGQTLAIVGASGCGKSTVLKIIDDIRVKKNGDRLDGSIHINRFTPGAYRLGGGMAFMFQEATLLPHLTVERNVALPLEITGKRATETVAELLYAVGLTDYKKYLPHQLSGGMRTRVSLARSFSTAPNLLLLDEPFSALDIAWKDSLYRRLLMLQERFGATVVLVTHDIEEAIRLADSNIIILGRNGRRLPYTPALNENIRKNEIEEIIIADHKQTRKEAACVGV